MAVHGECVKFQMINVNFYVKYGNIELKNFFIGKGINKKLKKAKIFDKGSHLQFTISRNN